MQAHALAHSLCGAALAIGACAGSTDPPDDEMQRRQEPFVSPRAEEDADIDESPYEEKQGTMSSERDTATCDYNDAYHCTAGHQGWRWVRLERSPESTTQPPPGSGNYCCVRVGLTQRSRGYRQ